VAVYNLCENHNNKYLGRVMQRNNPELGFFEVLRNYHLFDPYHLKVAVSFCSLICEKYGQQAIESIYKAGIVEMIENIKYKFGDENRELTMLVDSLLETYLYSSGAQEEQEEQAMLELAMQQAMQSEGSTGVSQFRI